MNKNFSKITKIKLLKSLIEGTLCLGNRRQWQTAGVGEAKALFLI